jgi:hypothetical protein
MSEDSEKAEASSGWKRVGKIFARIVLYGLLLLLLLVLSSVFIWPLEFVFHLIAGPFFHSWKNLPPFFSQWRSALLPLACLVIAIALAHRFIRWWIHVKGIQMPWRWKHTAAAPSLLLLGSAAAIAMSGIMHQAAWLASSPWVEYHRSTHHTVAINNARQIMLAVYEYETEHGKYPDRLEDAAEFHEQLPRMLWVETSSHNIREPFIFLKAGQTSSALVEPVLISPLIQPYDKVVVGYSDGSVRTMTLESWQQLAKEIRSGHE